MSIHFVRAALAGVDAGVQARLLEAAGIPKNLLASASSRVTANAFATLWLASNRERDDEFFGLDSHRMKVGSFALITYAVLHSRDLGQALRRTLRAFAAILSDIRGELVVDAAPGASAGGLRSSSTTPAEGEAIVRLHTKIRGVNQRRFAEETFLVMVHGLVCWLAGRRLPVLRAEFAFPRPPHAAEHAIMFAHDRRYDAPRTELRFDAAVLASKIMQSDATVKPFLRNAPQSVFLKYKNVDGWSARVRRRLRQSDGARWPAFEEIAAEFNVAPSTLGRRLEAEGTTFQLMKDEVRRDLAIHHLHETKRTVGEIARDLGYEDVSAFRRAFKKWTKSRPASYRLGAA